ncbi:MAG: thiamine pyrophosphate-dependent dehydrogenase E1 component subunit alpha [Lacipirellulaceae bacterium]|uniref:thiamine pyrophosphate-dependent dehydrogenase E1 component subunit alpha n=1 Tax=Marinobacter salarius TaxID=1420917 RepID=UPI0032F05CA8
MSTALDKDIHLEMYRKVSLIKLNDDRLQSEILAGRLVMPYYSTRGQEIIPSAVSMHLTKEDYIVTIYRGIHDSVAKGVPLPDLWAELAGRVTGTCKGKGGPMHITHPESGVMVTTGIVGSSIPIGVGLALASQYKKDGRVTVANFGDGASNIGSFHEGLNLASVWKLPVVFVCQNNRYAEHTSYEKGTSCGQIADRAASYNMPGVRVDGNDPEAMYQAASEAIDRARSGGGPTLIEAMTFRFCGHNLGDKSSYIPADEMEEAKANDPVPRYQRWLVEQGYASEADIESIDRANKEAIDSARDYAYSSEYADVSEIKRDVYAYDLD